MVGDGRVIACVQMLLAGCRGNEQGTRTVIEAFRLFGYISEMEYSALNTELTNAVGNTVRSDGAETIELARMPKDPEEILPKEF